MRVKILRRAQADSKEQALAALLTALLGAKHLELKSAISLTVGADEAVSFNSGDGVARCYYPQLMKGEPFMAGIILFKTPIRWDILPPTKPHPALRGIEARTWRLLSDPTRQLVSTVTLFLAPDTMSFRAGLSWLPRKEELALARSDRALKAATARFLKPLLQDFAEQHNTLSRMQRRIEPHGNQG